MTAGDLRFPRIGWGPILALTLGIVLAGCGTVPRVVELHDPLSPEEHLALGVAYEGEGKRALARTEYEAVLRRHPEHVQALTNLGNLAAADGALRTAEGWYRRAVRIGGPQAAPAANNLSWLYLKQGKRLAIAEKLARDAVTWEPRPAHYDTLVAVLIASERFIEAGKVLDEAETGLPRDPGATNPFADRKRELAAAAHARGKTLLVQGHYPSAEALVREAVHRDPSRASSYLTTLAEVLLVSGKPLEASKAIEEAQSRASPGDQQAELAERKRALAAVAHARGRGFLGEGRLDSAETLLREAVRWDPDRAPVYLDTLARVLIAEEEFYEAGVVIDEAEHLTPAGEAELRARLWDRKAELFAARGLTAEAQAAARQAQSLRQPTAADSPAKGATP